MTRVDDKHTLIGKDEEGWVVVVVGLEIAAHEHLGAATCEVVNLQGLDIAVYVDVSDIRGIDGARLIGVVGGARVGKPAPSALLGELVARVALLLGSDSLHGYSEQGNQ